jgi:hypothetical protein
MLLANITTEIINRTYSSFRIINPLIILRTSMTLFVPLNAEVDPVDSDVLNLRGY